VVAAAVLHKHRPIIRIGAGLIQFAYERARTWPRSLPVTEMHFRIFWREFCAFGFVFCLSILMLLTPLAEVTP